MLAAAVMLYKPACDDRPGEEPKDRRFGDRIHRHKRRLRSTRGQAKREIKRVLRRRTKGQIGADADVRPFVSK